MEGVDELFDAVRLNDCLATFPVHQTSNNCSLSEAGQHIFLQHLTARFFLHSKSPGKGRDK